MDAHAGNSCLVFEKHFDSIYPDIQLEYILESQGISDYSARLFSGKEYKHVICDKDGLFSELYFPNVEGDYHNPFLRYQCSSRSSSNQCSKLLDLVGLNVLDLNDANPHEVVFDDLVLSYPLEIDRLLLDAKYRSRSLPRISKSGLRHSNALVISKHDLIDRMNRCFSHFFKDLHILLKISNDHTLGECDHLHLWSSANPMMPNAHHHVNLPHFSYLKRVTSAYRSQVNFWVSEPLFDEFKDCISVIRSKGNRLSTNRESSVEGIHIQSPKRESTDHRYIVDRSRYNEFRFSLSNKLAERLHFESLPWFGLVNNSSSLTCAEVPLDHSAIRELWSKCVFDEFSDILGPRCDRLLDVYIQFTRSADKPKLLHHLTYCNRPAIVDLDAFFKKCSGVILDHSSLDLSKVRSYLLDLISSYSHSADDSKAAKYESMLSKFDSLCKDYSAEDFYSWLRFLSLYKTQTKVRGFWRNIKRYMLDPDYQFLISEDICPFCGGSINHLRYVSDPVIDYVIIRSRSNLTIFKFDGG